MPAMTIKFQDNKDEASFPDLAGRESDVIHLGQGAPPITVVCLEAGMESGLPSVCMRMDLPDGKVVLVETSAQLLCTAARAIMARYPNLFA